MRLDETSIESYLRTTMRRLGKNILLLSFSASFLTPLAACSLLAELDFSPTGGQDGPNGSPEAGGSDGWTSSNDAGSSDASTAADARSDAAPQTRDGAVATVYPEVVLADRPSAYWRLGDKSGAVAADETRAHPGTYEKGFTLGVPGIPAGETAVRLDGQTGSRIRIGDVFDFANRAPFTLEAWAKWDIVDGTSSGYVFAKKFSAASDSNGYALSVTGLGSNTVLWTYTRTGPGGSDSLLYNTARSAAFVHAVATFDGTDGRLFFDGAEVVRDAFQQSMFNTGASLVLGSHSAGTNAFKGTLDEVAIYDRALPAERVRAHFLAGTKTGFAP